MVLERVVAGAERADVGRRGVAAFGVGLRVVGVAATGGAAAAGGDASAVAHLDVAQQRAARAAVRMGAQASAASPAVGELRGDVGDDGGPRGVGTRIVGQRGELLGRDVQLDDAAFGAGERLLGCRGPTAGGARQQQVAVVVDDREAPRRLAVAPDEIARHLGEDRAPAGDLAGALVEVEQRGQADADLDAYGSGLRFASVLGLLGGDLVGGRAGCAVDEWAVGRRLIAGRCGVCGPVRRGRGARLRGLGDQGGDDLGGGVAGEAAVEEAQEDVGSDLGDRARVARAAQLLGQFVDPGAGGGRLFAGEPGGADNGGAVGGEVADHLPGGDRSPVAAGGGLGIDRQQRAGEPMAQLSGGEAWRGKQVGGAEHLDLLGCELRRAEDIGEHPGLAVIDAARVERGGHQRQRRQLLGELQLARGTALRPRERRGDLAARPIAESGTGGIAGERGYARERGGHAGVVVCPLP
jgi:hypothetical protein